MTDERQSGPAIAGSRDTCLFCKIAAGKIEAHLVAESADAIAFLDHRPVFPGHTLIVPRVHFETLTDLPADAVGPFFTFVQRITRAVETGLGADGSFVAMNNRVSQSVPHLHAHVVPRRKKDGLRGFFWPRQKYESEDEARRIRDAIREAVR